MSFHVSVSYDEVIVSPTDELYIACDNNELMKNRYYAFSDGLDVSLLK